ncbi:alginate lyase family protein [Kushneria sp. TE3]|uniref:alginate lyase family protein n=1 Tax=Kushneria sp. TE3 TaxID=3449832 RepID=UPI003F685854
MRDDSLQILSEASFVLYRIIGNDLEPRHARGQSRDNLRFILENEPELEGCKKRWVVNRIVNPEEHAAILALLEQYNQHYIDLPFDRDEYVQTGWDFEGLPFAGFTYSEDAQRLNAAERDRLVMRLYRHKNNYVMHNNAARNVALEDGRQSADWILPWDGNCFVTNAAWAEIRSSVLATPHWRYQVVPMARITDNQQLVDETFRPEANEEPQLIFRRDAAERFDEAHPYGRRPKVELFWRLGISGKWDQWAIEPWDLPCPPYAEEAGHFGYAGWVARLNSGKAHLETDPGKGLVDRGVARIEAVRGMLDHLDAQYMPMRRNDGALLFYADSDLSSPLVSNWQTMLAKEAESALERGPYSVIDKTTLPPSGDINDYWHPAPYYWPNPILPKWLPYMPRDGVRVPGTVLYAPESDQYDRTRLQRLFDDVTTCALAWKHVGGQRFAEHGAMLIRTWFCDPQTRMNPHLNYAQVRQGHNRNRGSKSGIIEMKDIYFLLDAIRLLERADTLDETARTELRRWLKAYLHWLQTSAQGRAESRSGNNHGTYYDLQIAAIASFLEDYALVSTTLRTSQERILQQFAVDGSQPEELKRTTSAHYCCFNLQGWVHLALLAERHGQDLWSFHDESGRGLRKGFEWLLAYQDQPWPWQQINAFDVQRFQPLRAAWQYAYAESSLLPQTSDVHVADRLFHPHDGIRPWWFLGQERTGKS